MGTRRPEEHDPQPDQHDLRPIAGSATDDDPDVIAGMLRLEVLRADEGEISEIRPTRLGAQKRGTNGSWLPLLRT